MRERSINPRTGEVIPSMTGKVAQAGLELVRSFTTSHVDSPEDAALYLRRIDEPVDPGYYVNRHPAAGRWLGTVKKLKGEAGKLPAYTCINLVTGVVGDTPYGRLKLVFPGTRADNSGHPEFYFTAGIPSAAQGIYQYLQGDFQDASNDLGARVAEQERQAYQQQMAEQDEILDYFGLESPLQI
jgi:hypothetical protein